MLCSMGHRVSWQGPHLCMYVRWLAVVFIRSTLNFLCYILVVYRMPVWIGFMAILC